MNEYNCYSLPLMQYLAGKGIKFKMMKVNPSTGKSYFIYDRTEQLDKALSQWTANRPAKK